MIKHYSDINDYAIIRINTDNKDKELPSNLETEKAALVTCQNVIFTFFVADYYSNTSDYLGQT